MTKNNDRSMGRSRYSLMSIYKMFEDMPELTKGQKIFHTAISVFLLLLCLSTLSFPLLNIDVFFESNFAYMLFIFLGLTLTTLIVGAIGIKKIWKENVPEMGLKMAYTPLIFFLVLSLMYTSFFLSL